MNMVSSLPSAKVSAGALAGAAVAIIVFILNYWFLTEKPIPGELASLVTFLVSGIVSYLVPPSRADVSKEV